MLRCWIHCGASLSTRTSISILSYTLSGNAFGRAWVLSELLREAFDVHIVAACSPQEHIWEPARRACNVEVRRWHPRSYARFCWQATSIARELVTGDVVYAVKPRLLSFGLALSAVQVQDRPLVLDIDDWELGFNTLRNDLLQLPWALLSPRSDLHTRLIEHKVRRADAITVSNSFLHRRFGGTWVPHARDEAQFAPRPAQPSTVKTVVFVGTPRRHKGLDTLVEAFRSIRVPARLRIVGGTLDKTFSAKLKKLGDPRICAEAPIPVSELAGVLGAADIVAIPQDAGPRSVGQLPAKLLDAMAMGKAIVSTNVGDIPSWLGEGAGVVVEPGHAPALADALQRLMLAPEEARVMGERARARFLEFGSYAEVRPRLVALLKKVQRREALSAQDLAPPSWQSAAKSRDEHPSPSE